MPVTVVCVITARYFNAYNCGLCQKSKIFEGITGGRPFQCTTKHRGFRAATNLSLSQLEPRKSYSAERSKDWLLLAEDWPL